MRVLPLCAQVINHCSLHVYVYTCIYIHHDSSAGYPCKCMHIAVAPCTCYHIRCLSWPCLHIHIIMAPSTYCRIYVVLSISVTASWTCCHTYICDPYATIISHPCSCYPYAIHLLLTVTHCYATDCYPLLSICHAPAIHMPSTSHPCAYAHIYALYTFTITFWAVINVVIWVYVSHLWIVHPQYPLVPYAMLVLVWVISILLIQVWTILPSFLS